MNGNSILNIYKLIDDDRIDEAEENLEYLSTNELESLFNYLTSVKPIDNLMKSIEKEIIQRMDPFVSDIDDSDDYFFYE